MSTSSGGETSRPSASAYPGQDLEALANLPHYYEWIIASFGPRLCGNVIEVGAGLGNFSSHLLRRASMSTLTEPDQRMYEQLAARFHDVHTAHVFHGTPEELPPKQAYDALVAVNVLEHIEDDHAAVASWASVVRPGGAVLLFVPALPWLYGSLDRAVLHHRRYTRDRLIDVMSEADLHVLKLVYFDSVGVIPWFVVSRLLGVREFSRRSAVAYDRFAVPILSRIEPRVPPPVGKNLLCVAIKPEA